jgi:hypothetical protein
MAALAVLRLFTEPPAICAVLSIICSGLALALLHLYGGNNHLAEIIYLLIESCLIVVFWLYLGLRS